jgi:O-antigen/teichoic acid export membrane protein
MPGIIIRPVTYIKNLLNKGHSRSVNAKKNILASLAIKGCTVAISIISVPLTLSYVDTAQYGIWLTLSSMVTWLAFFDIGLGNGMRNKFAEAKAKGEHELARVYVSTTYAILILVVSAVLILFFCINPFLNWSRILNAPGSMASELSILAIIVFLYFCMQFVLQLINTILNADQKPARVSMFGLIGNLASLIIIYILTKTTKGNLIYLGLSFAFTQILVLEVTTLWFFKHDYKRYRPSLRYVNFSYARHLMSLGAKFFFIQIAFIILYETSILIIAQLFGPEQVAAYNIAFKYFSVIPMVFGIIAVPFWSAYTEAYIKKDFDWIRNSIKRLMKIWFLFLLGGLVMLLFANKVYEEWTEGKIKVPFLLSATLLLYIMLNAWCQIFSIFQNGVGKIKLQLYSSIFGAIVNIPLALFLAKHMGISGVIMSTVLLGTINALWSPIQYKKIINGTATGIWNA